MNSTKVTSILIITLLAGCSTAPTSNAPESSISSDQLTQKRVRVFYEAGADEPFTGQVVEHYRGGALKTSIRVVNGIPTGTATRWYESGQKSGEATLVNGEPGVETEWYANGQMKSRKTYVDGRVQEELTWDEHGTDTTVRKEIEAALNLSGGAKAAVAEYYQDRGEFPADNEMAGMADGSEITSRYVTSVVITDGVIKVTLGNDVSADLTGRKLVLTPMTEAGFVSWQCSIPDMDSVRLPETCR